MEQFNLEKYLKNPTRKVVTRDGKSVRIICTDRRDLNFPIVALIEKDSGGEVIYAHTKDGICCNTCPTTYDLFFAPEKHEGWVNIFEGNRTSDDNRYLWQPKIYKSKEDAMSDGDRHSGYVTTTRIEWEE